MYRKNVASQNLPFCLVNASTGAALAGATVTAKRTIDGGAQASVTGIVSDLGNGQYNLALSQADTNGNQIGIILTATGAVPVHFSLVTTAADPTNATNFGISALPAAAAGTTGGLGCLVLASGTASAGSATSITLAGASASDNFYNHQLIHTTGGTGANQTRLIIGYVGSTKVATVSRAWAVNPDNTTTFEVVAAEEMPIWNMVAGTLSAATSTTATLVGAVATDNYYNGGLLVITAGTGQRQARTITGYVGGTTVATVDRAWATTPDSTSVYVVFGADAPKLDSSLQVTAGSVQGNVTGSVASVTGAVGSVTGAVGSVTGNVGGNVVGSVASVTAAVDILQSAADKVWSSAARTLTAFSQGFADQVWTTAARTLTAFGFSVTVGTNNDKTGYSLSAPGIQAVWDALTSNLTTVGSVGKRIADNLDATISGIPTAVWAAATRTLTAFSFAVDILQSAADKVWASATRTLSSFGFSVTVGTNSDKSGYSLSGPGIQAVWDALTTNLTTVGSVGKRIADSMDSTISGVAASVWASGSRTLTAAVDITAAAAQTVWDRATTLLTAVGSIGKLLGDNINATVASRSSLTSSQVENAVWDAAAASHNTAGTTGAKLNAAGGSADPLNNPVPGSYAAGTAGAVLGGLPSAVQIDTQLTSSHGAGAWGSGTGGGANTVTLTVQNAIGAVPIQGIPVTIKNSAETAVIAAQTTNSLGEVVFNLNDGTYKVLVQSSPSYADLPSQTLVVSGTSSAAYSLTAFNPGTPSSPSLCRIFGRLKNLDGTPAAHVQVDFQLTNSAAFKASGNIVVVAKVSPTTDADGFFYADLTRSSQLTAISSNSSTTYTVKCVACNLSARLTVPDQASADLGSITLS